MCRPFGLSSPGTNVGAVFERGGATVVLKRVARLESSVGLSFVVARSSEPAGRLFLQVPGAREFDTGGGGGIREIHLLAPLTDEGVISATLVSQERCPPKPDSVCTSPGNPIGSFSIDLEELRVPSAIWEEGSSHE